jgi:thioredoxin-related protein
LLCPALRRRASFVQASRLAPENKVREANRVKHPRLFLIGLTFLVALAGSSVFAKPDWLTDYKQAQAEAKASKKLVLLNFTGSDWCGWCIRLDREVFTKPEFKEYATKNLILLEVDFPRGKQLPTAEKIQNQELAQKYQVAGFPTIVVLDGDGKQVGELGYVQGGPSAFIAELEKLPKS